MSFNYKNPISPLSVLGNTSVPRTEVFGTNFSVLSTGGYMEVYSLSDLYFTIPSGTTGLVEFTGNTIPIQLNVGTGSVFSPDVLTLNSDNISSGRRRLGMLVYVIEEDQTYQFQIPNFESLWSGATGSTGPGGPTVIFSDFGTTIKSNSPEGISFISSWTANTIEDISGETSTTAVWKKINTKGDFLPLTGGTVSGDTIFTSGLTANTFSASTYLGLPPDIYVTGFTYDDSNTLTITRNQGEPPLNVTINTMTGLTVSGTVSSNVFSGGTFFGNGSGLTNLIYTGGTVSGGTLFLTGLSATTVSAATYQNLPIDPDTYVTGFTYGNNTFTITDNSGTTFNATFNDVTGLTINGNLSVTGDTSLDGLTANTISATTYLNLPSDIYITGGTFNKITETLTLDKSNNNSIIITGFTDVFVTGGTYNSNTFTFTNNTGGTFNVGFNDVTGLTVNGNLTVTGNTSLNGLTANTISATTYQNLPTDVFVTGGTFSGGSIVFTNNTGGTFNVSGISSFDTFVTGFTYSNNTFTISQNSGSSFNATINIVSGLTVNGNLTVTGTSNLNGSIVSTNLSGSTDRVIQVNSGGTFSATQQIISAYITSGGTAANNLENVSNWDINGNYTGPSITGTFQGQKHYDGNYFYEAVLDNIFIRIIRG